jgi:hypothetical protein
MTKFQWEFFLAQDVAGFDRLAERQGDDAAEFFNLFYADGWRGLYAAHAQEIEAEWRRRDWSRQQRKFILTGYFERHITLRHDAESELKMRWWHEWRGCEGWKTETFPQYLERMQKKEHPNERK